MCGAVRTLSIGLRHVLFDFIAVSIYVVSVVYQLLLLVLIRGAFKLYGILIFFSAMEADRNVKVVGGDVAVL